MTDGQNTCEGAKFASYQSVGAPMTRKAPVGHSKGSNPRTKQCCYGPDFVECLVVATSSWTKATAPSPQDNLSSECSNQYGGFSHSGVSQELWMPTSVHPVHLAISTWFVTIHGKAMPSINGEGACAAFPSLWIHL